MNNEGHSKKILIFSSLIGLIFLVLVTPKLPQQMRRSFLMSFMISVPIAIFFINKSIRKRNSEDKSKASAKFKKEKSNKMRSYHEILTKYQECTYLIKHCQYWSMGCLFVASIIVWIIKTWDISSFYMPRVFSIAVFPLALVAAIKNIEKAYSLDHEIASCIAEGAKVEKEKRLKETPMTNSQKIHQGFGIYGFTFVRISPRLMIIFCALNTGVAGLLAKYQLGYLQPVLFGGSLGICAMYFGRLVSFPYRILRESEVVKC